ncbi:uncharacterized protein A4U43_C01F8150 [Asparagus officinalis]|uniref:Protein kinase domain-containing protein n=1 Tax=Asparagus officinalis TaxID=4686 RepID=A0A5P1FPH7_ASPOF|nr:uncharacterized protein A4U43_C01F8150 [Asparagus officinalis]
MERILVLLQLLLVGATANAAASTNISLPGCKDSCGDISIPYPFGIGAGCFRDEGFEIQCKEVGGKTKAFYGGVNSSLGAIDISLLEGRARMLKYLSYACYNKSGGLVENQTSYLNLSGVPFTISAAQNKFTALGCDTLAYIEGDKHYESGCTSIPDNLVYFDSELYTNYRRRYAPENYPCSYAFVADKDSFTFNSLDLVGRSFLNKYEDGVPLVMDWVVGSERCDTAPHNASYACRNINSVCVNSSSGQGYLCNCSEGYEGNPYLQDGCRDINECDHPDPDKYPCKGHCSNTEGSYNCSCPPGYHSNDPKKVECNPDPRPAKLQLWVKLALGIGIGIVLLLVFLFGTFVEREKRKLAREKERFFQKNGGLLLYEEIKSKDSRRWASFKIFEKEEMEKATNNFDNNLILGRGGHGTVYKGTLEGNITVAIKKSRMIDESQKEEFVKEILILSQINHKNVVKLLGCCLEVEVPMLVYEFVSNGTLHDCIHGKNQQQFIPLDIRFRIAIESAEALAYLHSSASPPILHGDVKSSNVLLDENYVPKVSDFGASTLVALDETQFATIIQGTCGYLDPEYLQTHIITEKSDVYSFGVVLLELLTRKKVFWFDDSKTEKSLASTFLSLLKEGRQMEVFDTQLSSGARVGEGQMEVLLEVSYIAKQCLSMTGEERPTMKEVAEELQKLKKFNQHPWEQHNKPEELEILLGDSSACSAGDATGHYSLENRAVLSIEGGR